MVSQSPISTGSRAEAIERFRRLHTYLAGPTAAAMLWRVLNDDQRKQLGGTLEEAFKSHKSIVTLWTRYRGVSRPRAVVELSEKLFSLSVDEADWLLREMGELPRDQFDAESIAIKRGDLVVLRGERTVFLNGEDQEVMWGKRHVIWDFFLLACEHAKRGDDIDHMSIAGSTKPRIVADRIHHLRKIKNFPAELADCFEPVGVGTQRFTFPADQIHLFD